MHGEELRSAAARWIHRPWASCAIGAVGIGAAFLLERRTSPDVSFEIFYLFFVALVAWSTSKIWLYGPFAIVAASLHVVAGYVQRPPTGDPLSLGWNIAAHLTMFLIAGYILSSLRAIYERERQRAAVDTLTGAMSRRVFLELLERESELAHRYGRPHSIAFLDIDHFREVNNRYGHRRGDHVLAACARAMMSVIRKSDSLGRIGGDEFALLLPETGPEAKTAVEKVRDAVLAVFIEEGISDIVGISIGLVTCSCSGPSEPHRILGHADDLMYRAKVHGGNAVVHEVVDSAPTFKGR